MLLFRLVDFNLPAVLRKASYKLRELSGRLCPKSVLFFSPAFLSTLLLFSVVAAVLTTSAAQAQQSNGLTFYHLADATTRDSNGNTLGSTTTTINKSGAAGNYTLTGTVIGVRSGDAPTGTVSFVDASNNNLSLGTAALGAATPGFSLAVFTPPSTGVGPNAIVVGDFNGDGKLDIATTNSGGSVGIRTAGGPPGILLGNGDGTFTAGTTPETATHALIIAAADFNGDGKLDLAVDGGTDGALIILIGNGDGTFSASSASVTNFDPAFVATGDFNGDGKVDVAIANGTNSNIVVMLGNGDGTFASSQNTYQMGSSPSSIVVADFNNDGKADLAVQNSDNTVAVLMGVGDGTFTSTASAVFDNAGYSLDLVAGDFNGDGKPDLAASFLGDEPGVVTVAIMLGNGDGTFKVVYNPTGDADGEVPGISVADFNRDGKTDLALADNENISILLSNGDGTFTLAASTTGATTFPSYLASATGDFNGDGVPDITVADGDLDTVGVFLTQRTQTAVATLGNVSIPGAGTHNIQAVYPGDSNFSASTSSAIALTASQIATTLQLASSSSSSVLGAQLALTATLSPYLSGNLTTTGEEITFSNNGASIGTGTLASGVATLNITSLPAGNNNLTATYAGDSSFGSATSTAVSVAVTPSATPAVTVSPASLTFASETVGTTAMAQAVTVTNSGQATLTLTSITTSGDFAQTNNCGTSVAPGASCTIALTFTPTVAGSRTGMLTITDNASASPQTVALSGGAAAVSLSSSAGTLTIASPGGTASTAIQLSSLDGFSGTVTLTCAVTFQGQGTPTGAPTCSLNPTQVQVTGSSPLSSTLTISTAAASASVKRTSKQSLIAFAGLLFLGAMPRRFWGGRLLLIIGLCLIPLTGMLGCGGSSSAGSGTNSTPNPGTTAGNYQVVVTATSGALNVSTTIPLSIK